MTIKHLGWLLPACLLAACSASTAPVTPAHLAPLIQEYQNKGHQVHVVDVGHGQQTAAAMVLNLSLANPATSFKTQATSGSAAKNESNISHLEVFLYEVSGGVPPTAGTCPTTVNLAGTAGITLKHTQRITVNLTGSSPTFNQSVLFNNLPANTTAGDQYFLGVRALESGTANITHCQGVNAGYRQDPGTYNSFAVSTSGPVVLSTTGHTVTGASYVLAPLTPQTVALHLLPATGASVDANVTVNVGNTTLPAITAH